MQMTVGELEGLYSNSPMAVMMVDSCGDITYKNPACERIFDGLFPDVRGLHNGQSYEKCIYDKGRAFRLYITAGENESIIHVTKVSAVPEECFSVMCAAVRNAANTVSAAVGAISDDCSEQTAKLLNTIDGTMLTLLSEVLIPEQLQHMHGLGTEDYDEISLSEAMKQYISELGGIFAGYPVVINSDISAGVFARVDVRALKLVLTDFAARTLNGEYQTEAIAVKLYRIPEKQLRLTLSCGYLQKLPSSMSSREVRKPDDYAPYKLLEQMLSDKFGCRFEYKAADSYSSIQVEMPALIGSCSGVLRNTGKYYLTSNRFSDENAYMSRFGLNDRIKNK